MHLQKIEGTNFLGLREFSVALDKFTGVTAVLAAPAGDPTRSNGTGKSSLIQAIIFALYGEGRGTSLDDLITCKNPDGFKVELHLTHNGNQYKITRRKKAKSAQRCAVTMRVGNVYKHQGADPVQILKLVPFELFSNSVYSRQDNLQGFIAERPAAQKDILQAIFQLDEYLRLETRARALYASSCSKLKVLEGKKLSLQEQLAKLNAAYAALPLESADPGVTAASISSINSTINELTAKRITLEQERAKVTESNARLIAEHTTLITAQRAAVESSAEALAANKKILSEFLTKKTEYTVKISKLTESITNARAWLNLEPQVTARLSVVKSGLDSVNSERDSLVTQSADITRASADIKKHLTFLKSGKSVCDHCGSIFTPDHIEAEIAKQEAQLVSLVQQSSQIATSLGEKDKQRVELGKELSLLEGHSATIAACKPLVPEYEAEALTISNWLETAAQQESKIHSDVENAESVFNSAEKKLETIVSTQPVMLSESQFDTEIQSITKTLNSNSETLNSLRAKQDAEAHAVEVKKTLTDSIQKVKADTESIDAEYLTAVKESTGFAEVTRAFSSSGIPTLVLENRFKQLQSYVDNYINFLSDGKISVRLNTIKTSASTGRVSDTLQFLVDDGSGERDLSTFSGGEKVRVYLAIRLALAEMLSTKDNGLLSLGVIDEVSDLDDAGVAAFIDVLNKVSSRFDQVFVVSHIDRLKEAFPSALVLSPDVPGVIHVD